ncbi:ABC transporter ATP-binding protein [Kitasatospora camelliae]|uniref:ABC transporter ATP-binding protein n=1 Tax=Kitasatospora camelliae TaxID=3156397 RepID=A0AAU8K7K9_9ACTN
MAQHPAPEEHPDRPGSATARTASTPRPEQAEEPRQPEHDETLRFDLPGDKRAAVGASLSTGAMVRRLPYLVRRALGLAWQADRRATAAVLVCQALSGVLGAVVLSATAASLSRVMRDGPVTGRLRDTAAPIAVLAVSAAGRALLGIAIVALSGRITPRIARGAELALVEAGTRAELAAYNTPAFNDSWEAADRGADTAPDLLHDALDVIAAAVSFLAAAGIVATLDPLLFPALVAGSVPAGVAAVRTARIHYLAALATTDERRALRIYRWWAVDKLHADQVRASTIAPLLLSKYRAADARIAAETDRATRLAARVSALAALATGLGTLLVWGTLLATVATGRITTASALAATFALRTAATGLQGVVGTGARLYRIGLYLDDWADFLDRAGGMRIRRGPVVPGAPAEIRVRSLGYVYPGTEEKAALQDIDLTLRQGEVVAVVGHNGSGKSTLTRLLTGLLLPEPGRGEIPWDGVPIGDLDAEELWRRVAYTPQEFARWPLPALENVHLCAPGTAPEEVRAAVEEAARRASFDEVVAGLRSGWRTLLAQEWLGGHQLSGGEWQRAAVARSLYRTRQAPGLLVLDEPTSDLDPAAEHRILHAVRELAPGRITVLVTHNLANTKLADRILVMSRGRIVQEGTYTTLAAEPTGLFRELLDLQLDRTVPGQRTAGP